MNGLDTRDVEPARGRRRDEDGRLAREFTSQHDLLQVAARELPGGNIWAGGAHVIALHHRARELANTPHQQQRAARCRRPSVRLQHDVRGDAESRRDARAESVLRDVGDARRDRLSRIAALQPTPCNGDRSVRRRTHSCNRLGELALTVPRDAGDSDDLPTA